MKLELPSGWLRTAAPYAALAALAIGVVVAGARCRSKDVALAEARRELEAVRLEAAGALVASRARAAALDDEVRRAVAGAEGLGAELERLRAAAPGARTVLVGRYSTGRIVASGPGRASPGAAGGDRAPSSFPVSPPAGAVGAQGGTSPTCLLADGDAGELRIAEVHLQTRAGNRAVVGTAEAWRLEPGPPARVLAGPFRADLSSVVETSPVANEARSWGLGVAGTVGREGWAAGPAVATPPLVVGPVRLEPVVGVGLGPGGVWGGTLSAIVRHR